MAMLSFDILEKEINMEGLIKEFIIAPLTEWQAKIDKFTMHERAQIKCDAEHLCVKMGQLAKYLDQRCDFEGKDNGHKKGVKLINKARKTIWNKVFKKYMTPAPFAASVDLDIDRYLET